MPRELGLQDTDFDLDIHGEVDFDFFEESSAKCSNSSTPAAQALSAGGSQGGHTSGGEEVSHQDDNGKVQGGSGEEEAAIVVTDQMQCSPVEPEPTNLQPTLVLGQVTEFDGDKTSSEGTLSMSDDSLTSEDSCSSSFTSDSDITQVSPMSSASVSPLPFFPRGCSSPRQRPSAEEAAAPQLEPVREVVKVSDGNGATDMKLLVEALNELDHRAGSGREAVATRPSHHLQRRNMTFTRDEVRKIDRENQTLLRKILEHQRPKPKAKPKLGMKVASSAIGRIRQQKRIQQENMILLKKIQDAKPSKEVSEAFCPKSKSTPSSRVASRIFMTERSHPKSVGSAPLTHRRNSASSSGSKTWLP